MPRITKLDNLSLFKSNEATEKPYMVYDRDLMVSRFNLEAEAKNYMRGYKDGMTIALKTSEKDFDEMRKNYTPLGIDIYRMIE